MNDRAGAARAGDAVGDVAKTGILVKHVEHDANSPKAHAENDTQALKISEGHAIDIVEAGLQ